MKPSLLKKLTLNTVSVLQIYDHVLTKTKDSKRRRFLVLAKNETLKVWVHTQQSVLSKAVSKTLNLSSKAVGVKAFGFKEERNFESHTNIGMTYITLLCMYYYVR